MFSDSHRGRPTLGRLGRLALFSLAAMLAAPHASAQQQAATADIIIEAQPLENALIELSRQSGVGIFAPAELVEGIQVQPLRGNLSMEEALSQLLTGTGLRFQRSSDGGYVITPPPRAAQTATGVEVARRDGIEEIIVTGQKKEERIQDVPIAISAFSMEQLDNQKIEGGFDLLKAIPNVTFSKSNFTGYNFQIRGIGTQAISATTDPGVAVSFNNTTLIVNRLFEQEYLDIERVEVLRGPQGTLYGRNATAGVINVISAKPELGVLGGEYKIETGNYGAQRFRGHVNLPAGDTVALRAAFAMTKRDGYGNNLAARDPDIQDFALRYRRDPISDNIDNRDLWTGRFSIGWQPTDRLRANLIYERFEEEDRRMRSTKQLCHHADGNVTLHDNNGNPVQALDAIDSGQPERWVRTRFLSQTSQGCLPGSLFDKGDVLSSDPTAHGAYGTPNANAMPFIRAGRGGSFSYTVSQMPAPEAYPDCRPEDRGTTLITDCITDPMATPHGQSRNLRDIFSMMNPRYEALSELTELSFDFELSDALTLSSQTVYMENTLFSTQDFLRFKTLPMFNDSAVTLLCTGVIGSGPGGCAIGDTRHRSLVTPKGVFTDPQLGASDRFLMQDVSQLETRQLSQELRLVSSFDGPFNYSVGANYTRFQNTADYFVFINALPVLALGGSVYAGVPTVHNGELGLWANIQSGKDMTIGCGSALADIWQDLGGSGNQVASCIHIQQGSIDEVRRDPQGHHFFLSRNPFELDSAGLFGEVYYAFTPALKLTAGLRVNWDRKAFTPVPSQTMLADWRGRLSGGTLFDYPQPLPTDADMMALCDPRNPTPPRRYFVLGNVSCALSGMAENGRGYPALPDIVQEWRVPTGRIGLDWKADLGLGWVDETLLYAFFTRGYKAGGANPPVQSYPSGLLLEAAQGVAAPRVFEAEYVNAFEIGTKNKLFSNAVTLNMSAFHYSYKDYQVSKIVDRTAVNENFDASVWGLELETVFAPGVDTLFNASIGYLRTRIADGEASLDLMDRTQGGYHQYVDPSWAALDCTGLETSHIACAEGGKYKNGFDHWIVVRPTLTQASSCVAPSALVWKDFQAATASGATMAEDELAKYCPGGRLIAQSGYGGYSPFTSAPNGGAGFLADIGGNELPNAPRFTVSLGAQHTAWLPGGNWSATGRVDWYWQDQSFHRVYNTEYDRLMDWSSTNLSFWVSNQRLGLTIEAYAKNVFNDMPITGAFLNSDDTGLSTNVFTLDPRLIGLSIKKQF